jgi:hypothetical protein
LVKKIGDLDEFTSSMICKILEGMFKM